MSDFIKKCNSDFPMIMGVVNVTPDSFSDGGNYYSADSAIAHGLSLLEQGADILDIGGESTRPNAEIISVVDEIARIIPVIKGLADAAPYISIDTRNSETMLAAIDAGANIINDVSALTHDPNSLKVVADSGLPVCIMHMQGNPANMQDEPVYGDVVGDVVSFLEGQIITMTQGGVLAGNIIIDPGIGFGKKREHNLSLIKHIDRFKVLGCPIMIGTSRKSFIGDICNEPYPQRRIYGSIASVIYGFENGANIFRVHDVRETKQALDVYRAIKSAE